MSIPDSKKHHQHFNKGHSPHSAPKQFELLYRTRNNLPSQESYESLIFMKSKKCPDSTSMSHMNSKKQLKKPSSGQIKSIIRNIEKEIKIQESKHKQKEKGSTKTNQNNNSNNNNQNPKNKHSVKKPKLRSATSPKKRLLEYVHNSPVHVHIGQSSVSPTNANANQKQIHKKQIDLKKRPESHGRSRRDVPSTRRMPVKQKSSTNHLVSIPTCKEYILLGENFVSMEGNCLANLEERLMTTYRYKQMIEEQENQNDTSEDDQAQQFVESPQTETKHFLRQSLEQDQEQQQQEQESIDGLQNNMQLDSVQQYITKKVLTIQRWWRLIILRKQQSKLRAQLLFDTQKTHSQKKLAYQQALKQTTTTPVVPSNSNQKADSLVPDSQPAFTYLNDISQEKSYKILGGAGDLDSLIGTVDAAFDQANIRDQVNSPHQTNNILEGSDMGNSLNEFLQKLKAPSNSSYEDSLILRQNAAKIQFNTHKSILTKLYEEHKISKEVYLDKLQNVQSTYQRQLIQIQQIKQILKGNTERIQKLVKKTRQDIVLAEKSQELNDQELLNKIFGKPALPAGENVSIMGRQKSTGCHYTSTSSNKKHIFQKEQHYEDFSSQEQEDSEDKKLSQNEQAQFYAQNDCFSPDFIVNANFKQLLEEYKERQTVKSEVENRIAVQMGMIPNIQEEPLNKPSINTSITGIHQFLVTFFKFYTYYYKDDFLRFINMPFGYSPQRRLAYMQNYQTALDPQQDEEGVIYGLEAVINEQVLEDFHDHYYQQVQNPTQLRVDTIQYDRIHNKAVFDAFNEALNQFRPYYQINGPPFPWNNSEKALTFYFIAEQNIREVFQKTQFKVLKWSSSMCGITLNRLDRTLYTDSKEAQKQKITVEQALQHYRESSHAVVVEVRQEKMSKTQKLDVQDKNYEWLNLEEQKTALFYEVASLLMEQLAVQTIEEWKSISRQTKTTDNFGQAQQADSFAVFQY